MPRPSAAAPISGGSNAPPTMAMQRMLEPWPVYFPRRSRASAKIVGNMMELKKPTETTDHRPMNPVVNIDDRHTSRAKTMNRQHLAGLVRSQGRQAPDEPTE